MKKETLSDKAGETGETIAGFALVALLLFFSLFMLTSVSRLFFVEGLVKNSLNETLRSSLGEIDLWVTDPEGQDKETFSKAVSSLNEQFAQAGLANPETLDLTKYKHFVGGKEVEMRLAFLPPGYCTTDSGGRTLCNSHVCDIKKVSGTCKATICLPGGNESEEIPCNEWESWQKKGATWGSCEKDQLGAPLKSLCARLDDGKKTYHEKLRNYPVELKASFKVETVVGPIVRDVVVAGFPRILIKEQVAAVDPPPVCTGNWIEVRSCAEPAECGVLSATGSINWVCSNNDCWCKQRPADGTYQCNNPNPYPGRWVCNYGACSFPNAGNTPASCLGTQTCTPVCSDSNQNCCNPTERPQNLSQPCARSGGSWVPGTWGSCTLPSGQTCGAGTESRPFTCQNPPCCSSQPTPETRACNQPCGPDSYLECDSRPCDPWEIGNRHQCYKHTVYPTYKTTQWMANSACSPPCADTCQPNPSLDCVYILGHERYVHYTGLPMGSYETRQDIPQCLKDEFINNKRCQFVQDETKMEYCKWNTASGTCNWTTDEGSSGAMGSYGGGHGMKGVYWADACYVNSNVFNDPSKRSCYTRCRTNRGFNCVTTKYGYEVCGFGCTLTSYGDADCPFDAFKNNLGPSGLCIKNTCGMRRYDLGALYDFLKLPRPADLPAKCTDGIVDYDEFSLRASFGDECRAQWYLDANCNVVPAGPRICGVLDIQSTPISLVWEEVAVTPTVARFPLDPTDSAEWSVWKGSAAMPLVIYDPKHQGKVTSAMQLFGRYALGGRETELVKTSGDIKGVKPGKSWQHGYEALAVLDTNEDGRIADSELEPLALWFDKNQDAATQTGEVISIRDAGVTALFYKDTKPLNGELGIKVGFERNINGASVVGASVDWMGAIYKTKADAMMALLAEENKKNEQILSATEQWYGNERRPLSSQVRGLKNPGDFEKYANLPDVSGFWQWAIMDESGRASAPGYFVLNDDGFMIDGWSVTTAKAGNTATKKSGEIVMTLPLIGQKGLDQAGGQELSLLSKQTRSLAESTVSVSPSGNAMYGKTVHKPIDGGGKARLEYTWYARRIRTEEAPKQ